MSVGYVGRLDAEKRIGLLMEVIDALPPAIGVGESLYEQLTGADVIEPDRSGGTAEVVR